MKLQNITGLGMLMSAAIGMLGTSSAQAQLFTASGTSSDTHPEAASANFAVSGGQLVVTLINTEVNSTYGIADTLYGVFFNGATGLSLISAVAPAGDTLWSLNPPPVTSQTLSSSMNIPNWTLQSFAGEEGASALGGGTQSYGLVSAGFNPADAGDGLVSNANHNPVIQDELILTFSYTSLSTINDVLFRYNTSGEETLSGVPTTPAPEASTVFAGALMLLPLGVGVIRAVRKEKALAPAKVS